MTVREMLEMDFMEQMERSKVFEEKLNGMVDEFVEERAGGKLESMGEEERRALETQVQVQVAYRTLGLQDAFLKDLKDITNVMGAQIKLLEDKVREFHH